MTRRKDKAGGERKAIAEAEKIVRSGMPPGRRPGSWRANVRRQCDEAMTRCDGVKGGFSLICVRARLCGDPGLGFCTPSERMLPSVIGGPAGCLGLLVIPRRHKETGLTIPSKSLERFVERRRHGREEDAHLSGKWRKFGRR